MLNLLGGIFKPQLVNILLYLKSDIVILIVLVGGF